MRLSLLDILVCPGCRQSLTLDCGEIDAAGSVVRGTLLCGGCNVRVPITAGIPRFVKAHDADSSFGYQWNQFRTAQLDSVDGAGVSAARLWSETGWSPQHMVGRRVLDVGCGAGRFLEIIAQTDCDVVGVDVSNAIDAAALTVRERANVDLVQADVYRLPFRAGVFDDCYFIGVAQHTPDPPSAIAALPQFLKPDGRLAISMYERKPWTLLNAKYLLRPITTRMNKRLLLGVIKTSMPVLFPLTEVLFRLPLVGKAFTFVIPIANYVHLRQLSFRQRYQLALLDTFDRLAPAFDHPLTAAQVSSMLVLSGMREVQRLPNPGVNIVSKRAPAI